MNIEYMNHCKESKHLLEYMHKVTGIRHGYTFQFTSAACVCDTIFALPSFHTDRSDFNLLMYIRIRI